MSNPPAKKPKFSSGFAEALSLLDDPNASQHAPSSPEDEPTAAALIPELSSDEGESSDEAEAVPAPASQPKEKKVHFDSKTRSIPAPEPAGPSSSSETKPVDSEQDDEGLEVAKSTSEEEEIERVKQLILLANLDTDQLERYESMRRSSFPKSAVKRLIYQATGCAASNHVTIAIAGMAKVFIGELVEEALAIKNREGDETDPIHPSHLRAAYKKMDEEDRLYPAVPRKKPFL